MENLFTGQFQSVIYELMLSFVGRLDDQAGSTPKAKWVQPGTPYSSGLSSVNSSNPGEFDELIQQASIRNNVDPHLVRAVIRAESNFNPNAVSSAGARGLMQLMPGTARGLGVTDSFDPEQNINGGVKLIRQLLNSYEGDVSLALAAYNAGPGAVNRYGGIPPYKETQTYVSRVLEYLQSEYSWSV